MDWFLRLFPAYRLYEANRDRYAEAIVKAARDRMRRKELEDDLTLTRATLSASEAEVLRLQDQLDSAVQDRTKLWDLVQESLTNERKTYQMEVNASWQRQYGIIPHPEAPSIPENLQNSEDKSGGFGRQGRLLPSEIIANAETAFWERKREAAKKPEPAPVE